VLCSALTGEGGEVGLREPAPIVLSSLEAGEGDPTH
jgi:hypothetical protein